MVTPVALCQARGSGSLRSCMIGIEISSCIRDSGVSICFSHQISDKWSAEGGAEFHKGRFSIGKNDEKETHDSEFADYQPKQESSQRYGISCGAVYWPEGIYEGIFTGMGIKTTGQARIGWTIKAGRYMKIWKGIGLSISIETDIAETWRKKSLQGDGLAVSLSFRF